MVRAHDVPGRVCLVGEHTDWAGGAALVVPMDRAVRVEVGPGPLSAVATLDGRTVRWAPGDGGPLAFVGHVADELRARGIGVREAEVRVAGDLPAGRGFSSSAALCVGLARALAARPLARDEEIDVAYAAEHDRAGVACGRLDPTAVAWGVPLFLRFAGDEIQVEPLGAALHLAVGSFRVPRDTRGILAALQRHHRGDVPVRDPDAVRAVGAVRGALEGFAAHAEHARDALYAADLRALGGAMDACQEIYEEDLAPALPALHAPGLARAVRALRAAGALGAKFSGAGGDGSVVGLYPDRAGAERGVRALDALGLDAFPMEVWCPL